MNKSVTLISLALILALILALGGCQTAPSVKTAVVEPIASPTAIAPAVTAPLPTPTTRFVMPLRTITPAPTQRPFPTATPGGENIVDVIDYNFYPEVITVKVGVPVIWQHRAVQDHNVTARDGSWGGPQVPAAGQVSYTFYREGIYDYYCTAHPFGMVGRVVVVN